MAIPPKPNTNISLPEDKPSGRERRKSRRQERRKNRFKKDSIANAEAAEQNRKKGTSGEDPQGSDIANQSVISENFYVKSIDGVLTSFTVGSGPDAKRYAPGFTPNQLYWDTTFGWYTEDEGIKASGWFGNLLDSHFSPISGHNQSKNRIFNPKLLEISEKLGSVATKPDKFRKPTSGVDEPYSKRETLLMHNDVATDYFLHDTMINGLSRGVEEGQTYDAVARTNLANFKGTSWENQDPVIYGFEIIIDALSSPLLNGAVEEFIDLYPNVSEIQSRRRALYDFKQQFQKIFKTRGTILYRQQEKDLYANEALFSDYNSSRLNSYANAPNPQGSNTFWRGKKAYLAHYLNKIDGLHKLNVSNLGETKKYLSDWQKDFVKLTFNEDVSGTMASLMHLYNLLYWSKTGGKNIIPENLLRFNCEIVVHEVRNFNRVKHAVDQSKVQVVKDNVSRYKYSLRECQFYFDTPSHGDTVDYAQSTPYDGFIVNFDYKFSSLKYEKWVSDVSGFGQYVGYNNGAIWKIGNRGARQARLQEQLAETGDTGGVVDTSYPRFYTRGSNSLGQDGVKSPIELMNYEYGNIFDEDGQTTPVGAAGEAPSGLIARTTPVGEEDEQEGKFKKTVKSALEQFKKKSKQSIKRNLKGLVEAGKREIKAQIGVRAQLLLDTVEKLKNTLGLGGLDTEPINVYPKPYTPVGMGIFFDVRNQLYDYFSEDISTIMANVSNIINPFNQPGIEGILPDKLKKANAPSIWFNPLNKLLKKYSDLPAVVDTYSQGPGKSIVETLNKYAKFKPLKEGNGTPGSFQAIDPNVGFGGSSALPSSDNVKSKGPLKNILNKNAKFKPVNEGDGTPGSYIASDPNVGFGGAAVLPNSNNVKKKGSLMKILNNYANFRPADEGYGVPGTYMPKDFNVGFGGAGVKPSSDNVKSQGSLEDIVKKNTIWSYPVNNKKFP